MAQLVRNTKIDFHGEDHPITQAVNDVLESTGEGLSTYHGILTDSPDVIDRVCNRAAIAPPAPYVAFTDRHGQRHLPFDSALEIAKAFAAAEPATVLLHIDTRESATAVEAQDPAKRYLVGLLEEWRAGWALIRQWTTVDGLLAEKDAEIGL